MLIFKEISSRESNKCFLWDISLNLKKSKRNGGSHRGSRSTNFGFRILKNMCTNEHFRSLYTEKMIFYAESNKLNNKVCMYLEISTLRASSHLN